MFAVVKTGGKQYRLSLGDKLKIEQIAAEPGQVVELAPVFAVGSGETIQVGTPTVVGASVKATVLSIGRHPKVRIFKMRRRKHYQKRQGHRQWYTEVCITEITANGQTAKIDAPVIAKGADDLTLIEGIGPKIAGLLVAAGIKSFADLASASQDTLTDILKAAGSRYATHKPDTWPQQSALARDGKMEELQKLQDELDGGRVAN